MDLPSQMILFVRVVESGSFSAAARTLNQTPSAISRQIGLLEDRIGVRLLTRSQHGITLTEEGRAFHERCLVIAQDIAETETLVTEMNGPPRGTLRVAATVAFGKAQLLPILPDFLDRNPGLRVSLELTDRPVDLAAGEIDVAIRFSEQVDSGDAIVRKLASNQRIICAAPSYLQRCGMPLTVADLARHNCLRLTTVSRWNEWDLGGEPMPPLSGSFEANSADAIYHATLAGMGISRLSTYLVGDDLSAGRLVRVLPDYVQEGSNIVALYADRRHLAPKVRAFLDYLVTSFGTSPPWERVEEPAVGARARSVG